MARKVISQTQAGGEVEIQSVLDESCLTKNSLGKTTWSPASRVIGHEGNENHNVWVLCENIPVLVSAQNIRPAGDAQTLAHAILHGHSIIPDAIVRGQQEFEDATAVPAEDSTAAVEGSMSTATHVGPPHEDDGPLPSILENEVFDELKARRERSRSPVPERAAASS